jgi:hypothetical protein
MLIANHTQRKMEVHQTISALKIHAQEINILSLMPVVLLMLLLVVPTSEEKPLILKRDACKIYAQALNIKLLMESVLQMILNAHKVPEKNCLLPATNNNATEMTAHLVRTIGGTLKVIVLIHAQLLPKLMKIKLLVNNANKMSAMLSQFSKPMVNVRNAVTILNLKTTTLNVIPQNLYAVEPENGWVLMVHAKLVLISHSFLLTKNHAQSQPVCLVELPKHQPQLTEPVLKMLNAQAGPNCQLMARSNALQLIAQLMAPVNSGLV